MHIQFPKKLDPFQTDTSAHRRHASLIQHLETSVAEHCDPSRLPLEHNVNHEPHEDPTHVQQGKYQRLQQWHEASSGQQRTGCGRAGSGKMITYARFLMLKYTAILFGKQGIHQLKPPLSMSKECRVQRPRLRLPSVYNDALCTFSMKMESSLVVRTCIVRSCV